MKRHPVILFTTEARASFEKLPPKVRQAFREKINALYGCDDPSKVHKPLVGSLAGLYSMKVSRYRGLYSVEEEGSKITITIRFIYFGARKGRERSDVYKMVQRLIRLGIIAKQDK